MTAEEVSRIMGQLDYRWFNRNVEEWEYCKWLSGFNLSFKDRLSCTTRSGRISTSIRI